MALLRQTYYIYIRNLKIWVFQPAVLFPPLVMSGFFFLVFGAAFANVTQLPGFPARDYKAFLTAMILVQAVVFTGNDVAFAMLTDILSGYFDKLLLAPINRFSILFGSLLMAGTRALVQSAIIVIMAFALGISFKGGIGGVILVVLMAAIFGIAWSCLGLMIALRSKSVQVTESTWVLFFPFIFITTAFMPKEFLSGWFKIAVAVNPATYVLESLRALVITGWEWSTILTGLWVLAAMTVVLTLGATWLYRRATS